MKKRLLAAVSASAAAIALLAGPAPAGSVEARIHTLEYVGGGVSAGSVRSMAVRVGDGIGAVVFRGGPERFVEIEINDVHGLPVEGIAIQPGDDQGTHFCGVTEKPLRIRPFEKVTVYLMSGLCGDAGASVATTGTVTATFVKK